MQIYYTYFSFLHASQQKQQPSSKTTKFDGVIIIQNL